LVGFGETNNILFFAPWIYFIFIFHHKSIVDNYFMLYFIVRRVKAGDYSTWEGKSRSGSQSSFTCVQTKIF
jgi:hypothetical protein